jgi:RNA recognition motif-containing protein
LKKKSFLKVFFAQVSDAQTSRVQTDAHTTQRSVVEAGGETEDEQAMARIRPVYCGNFEYDARQSEIERMFTSYGKVERVDMKTGMCFLSSLSLSLSALLFFSCACRR